MSTRTISNVDMHVDDSTTSACGKNVQEIELKLNNDLQEIFNLYDENRIVINSEKTKIMIVTTRQKWQHLDKKRCQYMHQGRQTPCSRKRERLIGLQVDTFFTEYTHIQKTHNTIAGKLALLCRIKKYLPYQARTFHTPAPFYHTWTTVAHSGEMKTH